MEKQVRDDYGWEIKSGLEIEAADAVREALGDTETLNQLVDALSYQELRENLAYICRMNDLHIPQLVDDEDDEDDEDDNITIEVELAVENDDELKEIGDKFNCDIEKIKDVDDEWSVYRLNGNREDLKNVVAKFGIADYDFDSFIKDALIYPTKLENALEGQGDLTLEEPPVKYKGFSIYKTTEGKYDVYDKFLRIWQAGRESIEKAKKDIDETTEDKDFKKKFKLGMSQPHGNKKMYMLPGSGLNFIHYTDEDDDYWEVLRGGEKNIEGSSSLGNFDTLREAMKEVIRRGYLPKDFVNPRTKEALQDEYTQLTEMLKEAQEKLKTVQESKEKFTGDWSNPVNKQAYAALARNEEYLEKKIYQIERGLNEINKENSLYHSKIASELREQYMA